MAKEEKSQDYRIDQFFSGPGARADHWRFLVDAANAWSDGSGNRNRFEVLFAEIEITEEFHGYPWSAPDGCPEGSRRLGRRAGHGSTRDPHSAVTADENRSANMRTIGRSMTTAIALPPTCCLRRLAWRNRVAPISRY